MANIIKIFIQHKYVSIKNFFFFNFYFMNESRKEFLELLNIQIGCIIKINRLRKNISQLDLSLAILSNPTAIGRIERAEVVSGWDRIYILCQELNINIADLYILLPQSHLLSIVDEIFSLEQKLSNGKKEYYSKLKAIIKKKYRKIE